MYDGARDLGDRLELALIASLVRGPPPRPGARSVRAVRVAYRALFGLGDDEAPFVRDVVPQRAARGLDCRLRRAVQVDDQRPLLRRLQALRDVNVVVARR